MTSMTGSFRDATTILAAAAANTTTSGADVRNFTNILFSLASTGATLDVRIKGSYAHNQPDFTNAASESNEWFYVGIYNVDTGAFINGSTGIQLVGSSTVTGYKVNIDRLKWLAVQIVNYSAGTVTMELFPVVN